MLPMSLIMMNEIYTLILLIGLELVLGIDNVLLIAIVTSRLPESQQTSARNIALGLAFVLRIFFVVGASYLTRLTEPILWNLSVKGLMLVGGGMFLLFKAVKEINHVLEKKPTQPGLLAEAPTYKFSTAIIQLLLLDAVFSIDSVITAVGLTDHLWVIFSAVLVSFLLVLFFAKPVLKFIEAYPELKILALSFLITIGITLFLEGINKPVEKGYIYLPMGFALGVNFLQLRYKKNNS